MKMRTIICIVALCHLWIFLAPDGFSAAAIQKTKTRHNSEDTRLEGVGDESLKALSRATYQSSYTGINYPGNCYSIIPENGTIIEHTQIGDTWYDMQKNGSIGRMISVTNAGHRHVSWHYTNTVYPGTASWVDANCESPTNVWIGQTHAAGGTNKNAGYSNQTHLSNGTSIMILKGLYGR